MTGDARRRLVADLAELLREDPHFDPAAELVWTSEGVVGQGGMGVVHRVLDQRLGRRLALKLLHDETPARVARFRREARILARLVHPGVPPVHAAGRTASGREFLLMRFVDGRTLAQAIQAEGADRRPLVEALARACDAVAYAHDQGVVHRDLKPENIMLGPHGEVLVVDWGVARDLRAGPADEETLRSAERDGRAWDPRLTSAGALMGTLGYMPPEQGRGEDVGPAADVFALGATLCALLGGSAYRGEQSVELLAATVGGHVEPRLDGAPPGLAAVARRATAPQALDRYGSASALAADLRAWLEDRPLAAAPDGLAASAARRLRRHPAAAVAVCVAGVVVGGALGAVGRVRLAATREAAAAEATRARVAAQDALAQLSGGGEDRLGRALAALAATQRWWSVAGGAPEAARARFDAAAALAEAALAGSQWALAERAWGEAAGLGVDDARAEAGRAAVREARGAERRRRAEGVAAVLSRFEATAQAEAGAVDAVFDVVALADADVPAQLAAHLGRATADLVAAARDALAEAGEATAAERAAGEGDLDGLAAALEARPGAALGATSDEPAVLALARRRLWRRAGSPRGTPAGQAARLHAARRQAERLGAGRVAGAQVCLVALSRLPPGEATSRALAAHLEAEADEVRAADAAEALLRIGDGAALLRVEGVRRSGRFPEQGVFEARAGRALARRGRVDMAPVEDLEGLLHRALSRREQGDLDGSATDFEEILRRWPRDHRAWRGLAHTRLKQGRHADAEAAMERGFELSPKDAVAWSNRSAVLATVGKTGAALEGYARAIALDPAFAMARLNRGQILKQLGRLAEADADLSALLAVKPDVAQAWADRAVVRARLHRHAEAEADATRALALLPDDPQMHYWRGVARATSGRLAEARADLERAVALDPALLDQRVELGQVLVRTGDLRGALAQSDEVLRASPRHLNGRLLRAQCLQGLEEHQAALEVWLGLRRDQPRDVAVLSNLAAMRLFLGDGAGALVDLDEALALEPGNAALLQNRGLALLEVGRPADALASARAAARAAPGQVDAARTLASCALCAGAWDEARAAFEVQAAGGGRHAAVWIAALGGPTGQAETVAGLDGFTAALARFVLGRLDEPALLAAAAAQRDQPLSARCQALGHVGLRALRAGDEAAAERAWRACLETDQRVEIAWKLARARLAEPGARRRERASDQRD